MRKISLLLLALLMCVCVSSCGGQRTSSESSPVRITEEELPTGDPGFPTREMDLPTREAYFQKYTELVEIYGTCERDDYNDPYSDAAGISYLNGVCVVSLMDFNGDGIQDLFVVYSTGRLYSSFYTSDYEDTGPVINLYQIEIWTYREGELTQLVHEPSISFCNDFFYDIKLFITVYEGRNGLPVIQVLYKFDRSYTYTNIFYSDGKITRDKLFSENLTFQMNDSEIAESTWNEHVAGYDRILLSLILADFECPDASLFEYHYFDFDHTLSQTEKVVRYLSQKDETLSVSNYDTVEGEYISLYLNELYRSNRPGFEAEGPNGYFYRHFYRLYDIDQNGVPELILYEGSIGATMHYHFYTIVNGEVVHCGDSGRGSLYVNHEGGLVAYYGLMGLYRIHTITLEGTVLEFTLVAEGDTTDPYPTLDELGYENYEFLPFCPPAIPSAFYMYKAS